MKTLLPLIVLSVLPAAADVTGVWNIEGDVAGNPVIAACTLKQDEQKLSGSCKSELGESPLTGAVDSEKVSWKYDIEYQGEKYTLLYTATIDSDGAMKGTISATGEAGGADGTFTAKKKADEAN